MKNIFMNKKGFTLLELLAGISIIAISGLGVASLSSMVGDNFNRVGSKFSVNNFKGKLQSMVESPEAWSNTIQKNATGTMTCLANKTDCRVGNHNATGRPQALEFKLFDVDNNEFYASDVATTGFNYDGEVCNTFSSASTVCPFRYDLTWRAICPTTGACVTPIVMVSGRLRVSDAISKASSVPEPDFTVLRGSANNTIQRSCTSVGGSYDPKTNKCNPNKMTMRCPAEQMLSGVTIEGDPTCSPLYTGMCNGSQILVGYDIVSGTPVCKEPYEQIPSLQPRRVPIQCVFFGKSNGDVWYTQFGEVPRAEQCPDTIHYRTRIFELEKEMTCTDGFVVPTGRTKETNTGRVFGVCEPQACPDEKTIGDLYWLPRGEITEKYNCYGSDHTIQRNIRYAVDEQFICLVTGQTSTSRVRKTEITRDPCPILTTAYQKTYTVNGPAQTAPAKLLIVVDNSNSMASAQASLSAGLDSFLNEFEKSNIEVKVINTSSFAHYTSSFESKDSYFDKTTGNPINISTVPDGTVVRRRDRFFLGERHHYKLAKTATQNELDVFRNNVKQSILWGAFGNTGDALAGDVEEAGMCNALVALYDTGPNKFFEVGDVGGIIFLSDDNDYTNWSGTRHSCKNFEDRDATISSRTRYVYNRYRFRYSYNVTETVDGVTTTSSKTFYTVQKSTDTGGFGSNCTNAQRVAIAADNGIAPAALQSCTITWETLPQNFNPGHAENRCDTAFVEGGVTYSDLADYLTRAFNMRTMATQGTGASCTRSTSLSVTVSAEKKWGFESLPDTYSLYGDTIQQAIYNRGIELFKASGFFVTNIVNTGVCTPTTTPPQQTSSKQMALATLFANTKQAQNYPVCSANYSGALGPLSEGIIDAISNTFVFGLESNETVQRVEVIRAGQSILLNSSQYVVLADRIEITDFVLRPSDTLKVTVGIVLKE